MTRHLHKILHRNMLLTIAKKENPAIRSCLLSIQLLHCANTTPHKQEGSDATSPFDLN